MCFVCIQASMWNSFTLWYLYHSGRFLPVSVFVYWYWVATTLRLHHLLDDGHLVLAEKCATKYSSMTSSVFPCTLNTLKEGGCSKSSTFPKLWPSAWGENSYEQLLPSPVRRSLIVPVFDWRVLTQEQYKSNSGDNCNAINDQEQWVFSKLITDFIYCINEMCQSVLSSGKILR